MLCVPVGKEAKTGAIEVTKALVGGASSLRSCYFSTWGLILVRVLMLQRDTVITERETFH